MPARAGAALLLVLCSSRAPGAAAQLQRVRCQIMFDEPAGDDPSQITIQSVPMQTMGAVANTIMVDDNHEEFTVLPELGVAFASLTPEAAVLISKMPGVASVTAAASERVYIPLPPPGFSEPPPVPVKQADPGGVVVAGAGRKQIWQFPGVTKLQWGLQAINVAKAWKRGVKGGGRRRATVAVLDTGFWLEHPAIKRNIDLQNSKSFVSDEGLQFRTGRSESSSGFSHGTWVAGIIAGADRAGATPIGVAPECKLILIKVLKDNGRGRTEDVIKGIVHAVKSGADIINMSLSAGPALSTNAPVAKEFAMVARAVAWALSQGVTVVASAGNTSLGQPPFNFDDPKDRVVWPAGLPGVITVSATGPNNWYKQRARGDVNLDAYAPYSNYGLSVIDMAAPGGNAGLILDSNNSKCRVKELKGAKVGCSALDWIYAACCYNKKSGFYSSWLLGTSASAPFVSGVAALITSQAERRLKPTKMARRLRMATDDIGKEGPDPLFGYGIIDASKILRK